MILTILFISMFAFGLLLIIIAAVVYTVSNKNTEPDEFLVGLGVSLTVIGFICSVFTGGFAIAARVDRELDYQVTVAEYNILNERVEQSKIETDFSVTMKDELYKDILKYNNEVLRHKIRIKNPWFSWFYNPKIAKECNLIEFGESQ